MMDLIDRLQELSKKIPVLDEQDLIRTEEGTKNALIMPFINALGYNVFDPTEVTPELIADVGTKRGEKVDYAILKDGKPIILFECKAFGHDLTEANKSQLYRYFSSTDARFGVLTDGVVYNFYSDLKEPNLMDDTPFLVFDLSNLSPVTVDALKQFTKSVFSEESIIGIARELKYRNTIKDYIDAIFTGSPPDAFVRFCLQESDAYAGRLMQAVIEEFRPITQGALRAFISERVEQRLKMALANETGTQEELLESAEEDAVEDEHPKIVTTQDELDGYFVVKSIVREVIEASRVTIRDAQAYCSILVDDNLHRRICRLRFNTAQKYIEIEDERHPIDTIDGIYQHADALKVAASKFIEL